MQRKFFTVKAGIYTQTVEAGKEYWVKQDEHGQPQPLAGAIHISRQKLKELISEYPSSLLDKTCCFDADVEKEFFEDARREKFTGRIESEQTVIFFLVKREPDKYQIGCSSLIKKIEEID